MLEPKYDKKYLIWKNYTFDNNKIKAKVKKKHEETFNILSILLIKVH